MIHQRREGSVTILELAHGKANAWDLELSRDLTRALGEVEESDSRGVVLTATGSIFSAGVDLFRLLEEGPEYTKEFLSAITEATEKLFFFPKPVVGAANGHTVAGGCIIFCACDYRLMARGKAKVGVPEIHVGVPEIHVGVPFPPLAFEVLRFAVPPRYFKEVIYVGRTYDTEGALARGLVDELVEPGDLMDRALEMAEKLAALPEESFCLTKEQMRRPAREMYEKCRASQDERVIAGWISKEVRDTMRKFVEATLGRRK
jgi:enoyl-CoA hydratase